MLPVGPRWAIPIKTGSSDAYALVSETLSSFRLSAHPPPLYEAMLQAWFTKMSQSTPQQFYTAGQADPTILPDYAGFLNPLGF